MVETYENERYWFTFLTEKELNDLNKRTSPNNCLHPTFTDCLFYRFKYLYNPLTKTEFNRWKKVSVRVEKEIAKQKNENKRKAEMQKKFLVSILPKGIKDISDIFESKAFKDFVKKESDKSKYKLAFSLSKPGVIVGGKGRSFLEEYVKTLPTVSLDELATSKKALGRMVMVLNINEVLDELKK